MANYKIKWPPYRVSDVARIQDAVFSYGKDIAHSDIYYGTLDQLERMAEMLR